MTSIDIFFTSTFSKEQFFNLSECLDNTRIFLRTKFIFKFEINSVQQAELKEVMKKDRRTYSQGEIKKLFTDMPHQ